MTRWHVELFNPHLHDWRTKPVEGETRSAAKERALDAVSEGWEIDDVTPLCDFCSLDSIQATEAVTRIVVIDPNDIEEDEPEADPPPRIAWVCEDHHDVVQDLDTVHS